MSIVKAGPRARTKPEALPLLGNAGAIAAELVARLADDPRPILLVAARERDAAAVQAAASAMLGPDMAALFPAWDVPPLEGEAPSKAVGGRRMGLLRWLLDAKKRPSLVVSTPAALLRRVPEPETFSAAHVELRLRDPIDPDALRRRLLDLGYAEDGRVDEPGEIALSRRIFDVFPAAASHPCRIEHAEGQVISIASYDPATQRTLAQTPHLIVEAASEALPDASEGGGASFFDYLPDARLYLDAGAAQRVEVFREQVREAAESLPAARRRADPEAAFLSPADWTRATAAPEGEIVAEVVAAGTREDGTREDGADGPAEPHTVPRFSGAAQPGRALSRFAASLAKGERLILSAPNEAILRQTIRRAGQRLEAPVRRVSSWREALEAEAGTVPALLLPLSRGFRSGERGLALVTAGDLLGWRAGSGAGSRQAEVFATDHLRLGDLVVHFDHGVGTLQSIETIETPDGPSTDVVKLGYKDGATLMVPVSELDALFRYGGEAAGVSLDKLKGGGWEKRRNAMMAEIGSLADGMLALARERRAAKAPAIEPPREAFQRFCDAFPFELTADQTAIVETILADLSCGRPMERLVCGDVGFGKTEVALRAIAAVALSGGQVAFAAPTTVLVKQHLRNLRRRFAPFGIAVGELSRMTSAAEAKAVREGLRDGSVRIVVGTSALATKATGFRDLRLVVTDEEQRFGTREKNALRERSEASHRLSLTATPIPRTLEAGFVGLCDLSILATPPSNRQPVSTDWRVLDERRLEEALRREAKRGGQSFVVVPRIAEIEETAALLARLVPELEVKVAHGRLEAEEIERVMLAFGEGEGDVLLATNLIESGIDVPRANTMVILGPERFGLAQLHQLRGRVGRSARRGYCLLMTREAIGTDDPAARRLACLKDLSGLGSGFLISARDLDMRGAGELLGEAQAGHMKLVGIDLYRRMLERALGEAEGRARDDFRCELALRLEGRIPPDYVPDAETRIDLYFRAARLSSEAEASSFEDELSDRFGPPPEEAQALVSLARLRALAASAGITRIEAGPAGIALTFLKPDRLEDALPDGALLKENRLVVKQAIEDPRERLERVEAIVGDLAELLG